VADQMAITTEQVEQITMTILHKLFAGSVLTTIQSPEVPTEELVSV